MAEMRIAIDGENKVVDDAWVAVDGVYRKVDTASLALAGVNVEGYSPAAVVTRFTLTPRTSYPYRADVAITAINATRATIFVQTPNGGLVYRLESDVTDTVDGQVALLDLRPNYRYSVRAEVQGTGSKTTATSTLTYTPPAPVTAPVPTVAERFATDYTLTVPLPADIDGVRYDRLGVNDGGAPVGSATRTFSSRPRKTWKIRAAYSKDGVSGPWGGVRELTTKNRDYAPGTYTLRPTGSVSYAPRYSNKFRPSGNGMRIGNGKRWGQERGTESSWIFYSFSDSMHQYLRDALERGAEITDVKIYMRRRSTRHGFAGRSGKVQWGTHNYSSQPTRLSSSQYGSTWVGWEFARGESRWCDLPNRFGRQLVMGYYGRRGIWLGGTGAPFYIFDEVGVGKAGRVKITIR